VLFRSVRHQYLDLSQRMPDAIVIEAPPGGGSPRRELTAALWRAYAAAPPTSWLLRLASHLGRLRPGARSPIIL